MEFVSALGTIQGINDVVSKVPVAPRTESNYSANQHQADYPWKIL
jgi:hypothetical protein